MLPIFDSRDGHRDGLVRKDDVAVLVEDGLEGEGAGHMLVFVDLVTILQVDVAPLHDQTRA